jgi:tetratricopeptide (TPR) repeat protein
MTTMPESPVDRWKEIRAYDDLPACQIELLQAFLQDFPDNAAAWRILGRTLSDVSRFDEALGALNRSLELAESRRRIFVYCDLGELCRDRGDDASAEQWFRKAIDHDPSDAHGYIYLGSMLARLGKLSEAEETHRRATLCKKGCIDEAWLNLGLVLRGQGRYEESAACFAEALKIDPQYKDARLAKRDVQRAAKLRSSGEIASENPQVQGRGVGPDSRKKLNHPAGPD